MSGLPDEGEQAAEGASLTVIEPSRGWQAIGLGALWQYRELIYFLAWRDVKVRYKQTLLGAAWAILQPVLMMLVFTLVFSSMERQTDSSLPYPLFAYTGLVAWGLFATAVANAAQSVVSAERLVTKIYFPRLAIPLAAIGASLVDFVLASLVWIGLFIYYGHPVSWTITLAPVAALVLLLAAVGFGVALAALNVAYRDVRYLLPFLLQLWLLATPSVYLDDSAVSAASAEHFLAVNPLDGLVAFFRAAALGQPFDWHRLTYPVVAVAGMLLVGCCYFRRVEDSFADIL